MKKAIAWSIAVFLNLNIILVITSGVFGQSPSGDQRVFPTGFVVKGDFLNFFDRHGGIEIFGYPLTAEFEEEGRLVQYFHRGRMELHPENSPEQRVILGPLGELLAAPEPPVAENNAHSNSRFFPQTGHTVASAFLRFFEARGGASFFGYPITEMMVENEHIVQYFQRARLDWRPDNPPNLRVQLGRLGEFYTTQIILPPEAFIADVPGSALADVSSLTVATSVTHPFAAQSQPQTLYVFVYDQDGRPLPNALVQAVVHFPDGDYEITLTETNELGLSWQVFDVGQVSEGETVSIEVRVSYAGLSKTTQTSFIVWL